MTHAAIFAVQNGLLFAAIAAGIPADGTPFTRHHRHALTVAMVTILTMVLVATTA